MLSSDLALTYLIGLCPLLAVARRLEASLVFATAVIVVTPVASVVTVALAPAKIVPLQLLIAMLSVALVLSLLARLGRSRYHAYARYLQPGLPLLGLSCVPVGILLLTLQHRTNLGAEFLESTRLCLGYAALLPVFAALTERLEVAAAPAALRGAPLGLISLALMALASYGFELPT